MTDCPTRTTADPTTPAARGLLLFAHGARDPNWALPFQAVAAQAAAQDPACRVRLAFLEFMAPSLPDAGDRLAADGCVQVDVVPLFLGAGGHVRKDLPALMATLRERHPAVQWRLHPAVGEAPAVVDAMAATAIALAATPGPSSLGLGTSA
jgi:sirohydrochlorin cobaltochelatase